MNVHIFLVLVSALLLGLIPSLIWLMFFLKEDVHPEPKKLIIKVFLIGGILSALVSLLLEHFMQPFANEFVVTLPKLLSFNITPFVLFAIIEEVTKFFSVFLIVSRSKYFNEPIDAMVYTATGALGFAATEGFFMVLSNGFSGVFLLVFLRFIGATLLHALASTTAGYYWAKGIKYNEQAKFIFAGIVLASLIHIIFNLLTWQFSGFLVYPIVFLILVGFFVLYDFEELRKSE